jgi:hypothetical protein
MRAATVQACPTDLRGPERDRLPAVQHLLSFARPLSARVRRVRRPFHPQDQSIPYRLPREVRERLVVDLAPFRNRDSAYALAVFLARFWSAPGRLSGSFYIVREILADHPELQLTEARVRGGIKTLEAIGFLERVIETTKTGKRAKAYKPPAWNEAGDRVFQRKPVRYEFGADYAPLFAAANKRAAAARGAGSRARRTPAPSPEASRPSTAVSEARPLNSPASHQAQANRAVFNGRLKPEAPKRIGIPPAPSQSDANLEAALERLKRAIGTAGGGSGA